MTGLALGLSAGYVIIALWMLFSGSWAFVNWARER